MKVSEHLEEFHKKAAEHHRAISRLHKAHSAVCEEDEKALHEHLSAAHEQFADYHAGRAEECIKANATELAKGVSVIPTCDVPDRQRLVPRFGQPPTQKVDVPTELETFV